MALRTNVKDLLHQYDGMSARESWWFHHGTALLPFLAPSFRTTIEFRIIERLFIYQHKLSPEFQFAHYVNRLFGVYIAELGNVTPVSWFILGVLVCLNFLRAAVIDPTDAIGWENGFPHILSSDIASAGFVGTIHRLLKQSSEGSKVELDDVPDSCKTYILIYTYVCASLLFLYALFIYGITIMYTERILTLSLNTDGIAAKGNENMRASYKESLTLMDHRERLLKLSAEMQKLGKKKSEKIMVSERHAADASTSRTARGKKSTSGSVRSSFSGGGQKSGIFGLSTHRSNDGLTNNDNTKSKPSTRPSGKSSPISISDSIDFRQAKIATIDTNEDDKGENKGSANLSCASLASQKSTTTETMMKGGPNSILMSALGRAVSSRDDDVLVRSFHDEGFDDDDDDNDLKGKQNEIFLGLSLPLAQSKP